MVWIASRTLKKKSPQEVAQELPEGDYTVCVKGSISSEDEPWIHVSNAVAEITGGKGSANHAQRLAIVDASREQVIELAEINGVTIDPVRSDNTAAIQDLIRRNGACSQPLAFQY